MLLEPVGWRVPTQRCVMCNIDSEASRCSRWTCPWFCSGWDQIPSDLLSRTLYTIVRHLSVDRINPCPLIWTDSHPVVIFNMDISAVGG